MEIILIIICSVIAVALLVVTVSRAISVSDAYRAYKRERAEAEKKPECTYYVDVIQQGGKVRVESDEKMYSLDDGSEVGK